MSRRPILVTGAGGFVGKHLLAELRKDPSHELFASVFRPTSDLTALLPSDHLYTGDLTEYQAAESLITATQPDVIYHLAALSVVQQSTAQAAKILNDDGARTLFMKSTQFILNKRSEIFTLRISRIASGEATVTD